MTVWWCRDCKVVYEMEGKAMKPYCPDCKNCFTILTGEVGEIEYRTGIKYNDWIYSRESDG